MFLRLFRMVAWGLVLTAAPMAVRAEPLEVLPNGLPVAEARIDGAGPYRVVIDTAASNTNLLPAYKAAAGATAAKTVTREISGAAGKTTVAVVPIRQLTVGGRTHSNLEAFELPPSPIDALGVHGVLGADVITRHVLELDVPGRQWSFRDSLPDEAASGMHQVPFTLDEAKAPRLTARVNGVAIPAVLDTGARGTIMNWAAGRALGLSPNDARITPRGVAQGATAGAAALHEVRGALELGAARRPDQLLRIGDLPIFEVLGLKDQPAIIVGMDQLSHGRVILDFPNGRLLLPKS